jgi:hypothetical protein
MKLDPFIEAEKIAGHSVTKTCGLFEVSRATSSCRVGDPPSPIVLAWRLSGQSASTAGRVLAGIRDLLRLPGIWDGCSPSGESPLSMAEATLG